MSEAGWCSTCVIVFFLWLGFSVHGCYQQNRVLITKCLETGNTPIECRGLLNK
jgi:hypothetical protein